MPTAEELGLPGYRPRFYGLVRNVCSVWLYGLHRLSATGQELVPKSGPVVLAPTHRSLLDIPAVGVPLRHRGFHAMTKAETFEVPVLGTIVERGGSFPVRRDEQDLEAYAQAVHVLHAGGMLLIFPEGTRNTDGKARPQLGAARLALETGAALVPAAISGTGETRFWPPHLPKVRVAYGAPLELDDLRGTDDLRRASYTATKRWSAASSALLAGLGQR